MYKTEDEDLQWQEAKSFESSVRSLGNPRPHVSSTPKADVTPSVTVNQKPVRLKDFVLMCVRETYDMGA